MSVTKGNLCFGFVIAKDLPHSMTRFRIRLLLRDGSAALLAGRAGEVVAGFSAGVVAT